MLRSIALGCVDRRTKPGDEATVGGESLPDVLEDPVDMGDGVVLHDGPAQTLRSGKTTKLDVKHVLKSHVKGTRRVRTCLFLTPVIMLLVMFARPLYAPLIDVFGPTEEELSSRASNAAAISRGRFERGGVVKTGKGNKETHRRLLRRAPRVYADAVVGDDRPGFELASDPPVTR